MAKNYIPALAAALVFLAAGCGTPPGSISYDPSLPPEKTVLVVFGKGITVQEYNGISVGEAWYPKGNRRVNKVTLPAGEAKLLFNYTIYFGGANATYEITAKDIELNYNFEAEKGYALTVYSKSISLLKSEYGVALWDKASDSPSALGGKMIKSWKLGEF